MTSISALLKLGANPNVCTQVCIESSMDAMCTIYKKSLEMKLKLRHVCEDTCTYIVQIP